MEITANQVILGACISASIVLIVGIITAGTTIYTTSQARSNEKKLAILKVLLEAAYKEYELRTKQDLEFAKEKNETPKIKAFIEYVIFYKQMSLIFSKNKITPEDIETTLKENKILIDTYYSKRDENRPEYHSN